MVVSNIIQVIQTIVINKQLEKEDANKPKTVVNKVPADAKEISAPRNPNKSTGCA
ncbi:MAG: hypothetical protein MZU97_09050 [Bacillus subtilis]|nr:hypothetical protein [Bacillus subtilis]